MGKHPVELGHSVLGPHKFGTGLIHYGSDVAFVAAAMEIVH